MILHWIQNLFVLYTFVALTLVMSLVLFISLKAEIRRLEVACRNQKAQAEMAGESSALSLNLVRAEMQALEDRAQLLVPPSPSKSGMNLNKRTQAVRMLHRGESPEQVASALGLPISEVSLLWKVQRTIAS
jgi:DNA-binding NarL/FixJ family response regulator